ncbi:MAG: photosystem II biogenesis protein Psp29 [Leptolyngbyaceae cyanobacterium SL_7_1]|nr:photosystem II biogenesis protein Psp29 [Leptolyngbyaceae cyanobacterium SL_7_1]
MNTVRTVSDTKRAFYATHTRPINSIYRRVVEELMVEMHLLSVNADFRYDPIYALGVVTTFDRFLQGYRPEQDKESIFNALCHAIGSEPQTYRQDAERLQSEAIHLSVDDVLAQVKHVDGAPQNSIVASLRQVATTSPFKYSRLFAIGIYNLLELMAADAIKEEARRTEMLNQLSEGLNLSADKMQKDLELYRSNLDKMTQAQIVLEDILKADRKKREEREKAKDTVTTPPTTPQEFS